MSALFDVMAELALYRKAVNKIDDLIEYNYGDCGGAREPILKVLDELTKAIKEIE